MTVSRCRESSERCKRSSTTTFRRPKVGQELNTTLPSIITHRQSPWFIAVFMMLLAAQQVTSFAPSHQPHLVTSTRKISHQTNTVPATSRLVSKYNKITSSRLFAMDPSWLFQEWDTLTRQIFQTPVALPSVLPDDAALHAAGEAALNNLGHDVLVFLAATVLVVPLSTALGLTPVLGFLAAGFILGPAGLGLFYNSEADLMLGDFGILFLLFTEGLNLSPSRLKALGAFQTLGILQLLASMALFFFGILALGPVILQYIAPVLQMDPGVTQIFSSPAQAFCIAAAGSLSSSAFVLPVLKEKKWDDRPEGIAALSVLLLQDLAVAPLLVILPLIAGSGPQSATELSQLAIKATFGFGSVLIAGSILLRYVFEFVAAARSTETFVAAALLVALGMGQAADYLGLSASTGAFAAGVLLANNRYRAQIKADVRPFEGILLGIFFLTAGASLDPAIVMQDLPTLLTGIIVFIIIKALVLFGAGPLIGKTPAQAARVAITLAGGGEFSLVLFNLAKDVHILPDDLAKLLAASVVISMSLTPLLSDLADKAGNYLESLEEFSGDRLTLTRKDATDLFDAIDEDDSGTIEFEELRNALVARGMSYVSIAEIFVSFDTNGDGTICREEWTTGVEKGLLSSALSVSSVDAPEQKADIAEDAIVICGFTEFGREMYRVLEAAGLAKNGGLVAFDLNPSRVAVGLLAGANVVYGNAASPDLLRAAGVKKPRGVIIAFRSEAIRLDAIERLREALPAGTPIFARVVSGQSLGSDELLQAGATDVVSERTEAALRFGKLIGALEEWQIATLRQKLMAGEKCASVEALWPEIIPGIPEDRLNDIAEEFNCSKLDLLRLYKVFTSLPASSGDQFVSVEDLRDVFLRTSGVGPIDDDALDRWVARADIEKGGSLSFVDFARVYFSSKGVAVQE